MKRILQSSEKFTEYNMDNNTFSPIIDSWLYMGEDTKRVFWVFNDLKINDECIMDMNDGDETSITISTWYHDINGVSRSIVPTNTHKRNSDPYVGDNCITEITVKRIKNSLYQIN